MDIQCGKFGQEIIISQNSTAQRINLTRGAAKAVARFLLKELNVVKCEFNENGKIFDLLNVDKEMREWKESQK